MAARAPHRDGLRISDTLTLPDEAATETFAILSKRGRGKTHTASVMAEEMITAGLPVLIIDPLGVWWGLRASADGKTDGLPVVIFGGDHADIPLTEESAALIADAVVAERFPAIVDLSHFSKAATRRFMAPFIERLYHQNRDPLHVIVDEADLFAPQRAQADGARLLGAMEDLQRRGRARGIGTTMITQRPAVLHKDLLTQAEVLIALGMTGPRDVAAIDEWVRLHADEDQAREVKASLPSLPVGTAWVWSPAFLNLLEKVQIRRRHTYDSSATPKLGDRRAPVRRMAPVDLDRLGAQIAKAAQQAEESDPKALRRRVRELEHALAVNRPAPPVPETVTVEVPVLDDTDRRRIQDLLAEGQHLRNVVTGFLDRWTDLVTGLETAVAKTTDPAPASPGPSSPPPTAPPPRPETGSADTPDAHPPVPFTSATGASGGRVSGDRLPKAQRKILAALAQHGPRTVTQVAILTGYSHKSGGYRNALSALRSTGYIDGRGEVAITSAGRAALGPVDPLPAGSALLDWWKSHHLGKAERAIIDVLADAYPHPVPVPQIADATGYSASSGGFRNALSRLRSLELAAGRGELTLSPTFQDGAA